MELSRKRKKELRKLRESTEALLQQQRTVLGNAGHVFSEATKQARALGNEQVMPRVNERVDQFRPALNQGLANARQAAARVRYAVTPVVATALAKTVSALDNIDARQAARQVQHLGEQYGYLEQPRKRKNLTGLIALGVGIAAASAVAYAVWQAFSDDSEDMWVSSED